MPLRRDPLAANVAQVPPGREAGMTLRPFAFAARFPTIVIPSEEWDVQFRFQSS